MADVRLTATNPEDSSVVPVACDASGRLLLQELPAFDGTVDGDLTVSGKGSFAGGKSIIGNDGSAQFAQGAVDIYSNGQTEFTQDVNFESASFAGHIDIGPDGGNITIGTRKDGGSADVAFGVYNGGTANLNALINFDGSAEFSGGDFIITSSGAFASYYDRDTNTDNSISTNLGNGGVIGPRMYITSSTATAAGGPAVLIRDNTTNGDIGNINLYYDGSVAFAGNKAGFTAEGYLWCTTRRGDTVILDATSNGLASWAEYTPTSRIEDLRDKLDANSGDTGEMPADTQ